MLIVLSCGRTDSLLLLLISVSPLIKDIADFAFRRLRVTVELWTFWLRISCSVFRCFWVEWSARDMIFYRQLPMLLRRLFFKFLNHTFLSSGQILNPYQISLEDSDYLPRIGLQQNWDVHYEVNADQGDTHVSKFISIVGFRNEICEAHDWVRDQCDNRLVKQLHSSLLDWLVDVAVANDHHLNLHRKDQGHKLNEELAR